jgi:hypothetical protein
MIVGFTGSRKGMTGDQSAKVFHLLKELKATEGHHGDCIGADEQFHEICHMADVPVVIHPPEDDKYRAWCQGAIRVEEPLPYLTRNDVIIDVCEFLIAAPKEKREPAPGRGQGTWSTVRHARRANRLFRIVWPLGSAGWR